MFSWLDAEMRDLQSEVVQDLIPVHWSGGREFFDDVKGERKRNGNLTKRAGFKGGGNFFFQY